MMNPYRHVSGADLMGIRVDWFEPGQKNICYFFEEEYSWDDVSEAMQQAARLLDSVDYPVNILIDVAQTGFIPPVTFANMRKVAEAPTASHTNAGMFIVIGAKPYFQTMFDLYRRIYPDAASKYHFVQTYAELYTLLDR